MKDFGLVVIGAHFGVWLEEEISKYSNQNIILVEPVPYNNRILKKNFSEIYWKDINRIFIIVCTYFYKTKPNKKCTQKNN